MRIQLSSRERLAGLFLLVTTALVVLFAVGAAVENRWLTPRDVYRTQVRRGDGLRPGLPVLLSGLDVGEIETLTILPDNRVEVVLAVYRGRAPPLREGTRAAVHRLMGVGEKRIHLEPPEASEVPAATLAPGATLPSAEPVELLDVVESVDLSHALATVDRGLKSLDVVLEKLEERDRLERIAVAFDHLGPTMERMDGLLAKLEGPVTALVGDPSLRQALHGADRVFNDPNTTRSMRALATAFEPGRMEQLLTRADTLLARMDALTARDGHLERTLAASARLLDDARTERLLAAAEHLTEGDRLGRLLDEVSAVSVQLARIGPELPVISKETASTMRELTVVLKAMQRTWLLQAEAKAVLEELKRTSSAPPVPAGR